MRLSRTWLAALAATVVATGGLAACSPNPSGDATSQGMLTIARTGDIDQLDPARATAFQTVQTLGLVYDTLLTSDDTGNLAPGLATSWQEKGATVTFALRSGVKFHDGTPFTASDVKATLERDLDPKTSSVVRSYLKVITSVAAPSSTSVVLTLQHPDTSLLTALTYVGASILAEKDIKAGTVARKPNGTGPYAWGKWQQNQRLDLTANSAYWGGKPKNGGLEFRVIPDEASIVSGMKAHSFDFGLVSDPAVARQVSTGGNVTVVNEPTLSYHVLQLNGRRGPLANVKARQAIACAVDRPQLAASVYFGHATVTGPITSPAYPYDATAGLPCKPGDVNAAKQLLAASGNPNGFTLHTIVETGEYSTSTNIAQVLQSQLGAIGVKLDIDRQQTNVYVPNWTKANFDAAVALNGGSVDPYLQYGRYFTTDGSLKVPAGLTDAKLDQLLTQGNAATDLAARKQIFGQLQQTLLTDSPWVWLLRNQVYYLTTKGVTGFKPLPTESLLYLRDTKA
ncbi:ABC transporter substrate-binding protein [Fodinicola feengrottensis]|uniref:ABC transporter substrate-binding protein n=1 Tax=Fodinicola feengrottensis TaxID=435914 RepID=A0ABP4UW39_9ACTN|nr:ABC transporter substrate-binding protein [Fodinicola feengrottensis]